MAWRCSTCGELHEDVPLSFAADYPDIYANMSPQDRAERTIIGSDQCVIDEEQFYIRGCMELPVHDSEEVFLWGLWALVWKEDYWEIAESWEERGREEKRGPFKGRLANSLKQHYSPDTFNLKITVKIQPVGARPLFMVEEIDHPLAIAQRNGMSRNEVNALVSSIMHG